VTDQKIFGKIREVIFTDTYTEYTHSIHTRSVYIHRVLYSVYVYRYRYGIFLILKHFTTEIC